MHPSIKAFLPDLQSASGLRPKVYQEEQVSKMMSSFLHHQSKGYLPFLYRYSV